MKITPITLALIAVGLAAVYVVRNGATTTGQDLGGAIVGGAIDLAGGVLSGGVVAAGEVVGIPATSIPYAIQLMNQWDATPWYEKNHSFLQDFRRLACRRLVPMAGGFLLPSIVLKG